MADDGGKKRERTAIVVFFAVGAAIWTGIEEIGHAASLVWITARAESWVPSVTKELGPKTSLGVSAAVGVGVLVLLRAFWRDTPGALRGTGAIVVIGACVLAAYASLHLSRPNLASAGSAGLSKPHSGADRSPSRASASASRSAPPRRSNGARHDTTIDTGGSSQAASTGSGTAAAGATSPSGSSSAGATHDAAQTTPAKAPSYSPPPSRAPAQEGTPVVAETSKPSTAAANTQPAVEGESSKVSGSVVEGTSG